VDKRTGMLPGLRVAGELEWGEGGRCFLLEWNTAHRLMQLRATNPNPAFGVQCVSARISGEGSCR